MRSAPTGAPQIASAKEYGYKEYGYEDPNCLAADVSYCSDRLFRRSAPRKRIKELAKYQPYTGAPITQFSTMKGITGWNAIGDDKLIVWRRNQRRVPADGWLPCSNLAFANTIAFTSTTSMITTFDFVRLRDNERCPITEIRRSTTAV